MYVQDVIDEAIQSVYTEYQDWEDNWMVVQMLEAIKELLEKMDDHDDKKKRDS